MDCDEGVVANRWILGSICLVILLISAVGCSNSEQESEDGVAEEPSLDEVDTEVSGGVDGDDGEEIVPHAFTDEEVDTIAVALGWGSWAQVPDQDRLDDDNELARLRDEYVARCMVSQGFEYMVLDRGDVAVMIEDPDIPRGSEEFIRTYGFGLSTLAFPKDVTEPEAIGIDYSWFGAGPPSAEDNPNDQYYRGLDEAAQRAYDVALNGGQGDGGCTGEALAEIPDPSIVLVEALADQLEELQSRVESSPEYLAAAIEVDQCMVVEGFTFTGFGSIEDAIFGSMPVVAGVGSVVSGEGDGEVVFGGDGEVIDGSGALDVRSPEWRRSLAEVQQFELLLAAEFARCSGVEEWSAVVDDISDGYREEFLNQNAGVIASVLGG